MDYFLIAFDIVLDQNRELMSEDEIACPLCKLTYIPKRSVKILLQLLDSKLIIILDIEVLVIRKELTFLWLIALVFFLELIDSFDGILVLDRVIGPYRLINTYNWLPVSID